MCGIAFKRKSDFKGYFKVAHSRGTDGLGVITKDGKVRKYFAEDLTYFNILGKESRYQFPDADGNPTSHRSYADLYDRILNDSLSQYKQSSFALIHHRKATSGSKNVENVHPFNCGRYTVMQNGTCKDFETWAHVEGLEEGRPDSFYLSMWINRMEDFDEIVEELERLTYLLGVIVVVDNNAKQILYFSDGARSFHFNLNEEKTEIISASSLTDDGDDNYKNVGWMIFDFSGKIIENGVPKINELIKAKVTYAQPASTYATNRKTIYDKDNPDYENNPLWSWIPSIGGLSGEWKFTADPKDPNDKGYKQKAGWYFSPIEERWKEIPKEDPILELMSPHKTSYIVTFTQPSCGQCRLGVDDYLDRPDTYDYPNYEDDDEWYHRFYRQNSNAGMPSHNNDLEDELEEINHNYVLGISKRLDALYSKFDQGNIMAALEASEEADELIKQLEVHDQDAALRYQDKFNIWQGISQ